MARLPARASFLVRRGVASLIETAGTREAAQVAFFALLTFPAALLLAVWGASTILDDQSVRVDIVDGIVDALPLTESEGRDEVEDLLDGVAEGAGTLGLLGGLVLIWSASGVIGALRHSICEAWPTGTALPYFQGKSLDVGLTIALVPLALAALGLNLLNVAPTVFGGTPVLEGLASFAITEVVPALAIFGLFLIPSGAFLRRRGAGVRRGPAPWSLSPAC